MEWTERLATRIQLIDTQHQEIIRRINDVLLAGKHKDNRDLLKLTLRLLHDYCATHFSQEENLQLKKVYPQYKEHKKLHTIFLKQIRAFQVQLEQSAPNEELAVSIEKVVSEWLIKHIDGVDQVLAKYLIENNYTD